MNKPIPLNVMTSQSHELGIEDTTTRLSLTISIFFYFFRKELFHEKNVARLCATKRVQRVVQRVLLLLRACKGWGWGVQGVWLGCAKGACKGVGCGCVGVVDTHGEYACMKAYALGSTTLQPHPSHALQLQRHALLCLKPHTPYAHMTPLPIWLE